MRVPLAALIRTRRPAGTAGSAGAHEVRIRPVDVAQPVELPVGDAFQADVLEVGRGAWCCPEKETPPLFSLTSNVTYALH